MKVQPQRMCIACRQMQDKKNLIRVVKDNSGKVFIDDTFKQNGRGAYVCNNKECIEKIIKNKLLAKTFKCEVEESVYERLMEDFLARN